VATDPAGSVGSVAGLPAVPQPLLFHAGLLLFPCAAIMVAAAVRNPFQRPLVWLVVIGNVGWVLASVVVALIVAPNGLGVAAILAQAGAVAVLAAMEHHGLRKAAATS
jgi:hypothetical protein